MSDFPTYYPEQSNEHKQPEQTAEHQDGLDKINANNADYPVKKEVCHLYFYPPDNWGAAMNIKDLGKTLIYFQEVIDAIGQTCSGKPTVKGAIPAETLQKTALTACQIFNSPFGIQLKSSYMDNDIFDYSLISNALLELLYLFMVNDNEAALKNKLHELKGRAASKYQLLLKELLSIHSDVKFEWDSPRVHRGGEFLLDKKVIKSAFDIISTLDIAEKETIIVIGKLVGFNSRTKNYELSSDDSLKFSGRIADYAYIQSATINETYQAEIEQTIKTHPYSGEEKIKYELIKLTPVL